MSKNSFFNLKVLKMMIKENIENNKNLFLKDGSKTELIIKEEDYNEISLILNKKLEGKTTISIEDIDISIDDFLKKRGYVFDCSIENKYKKTIDGNYFYFGILELGHYSTDTSINNLIFTISDIINKNYNKLCKSTKVIDDFVNINIVKDNSSRFDLDQNKSVFKAGFNLKTRNLILNFNLDEVLKISKK